MAAILGAHGLKGEVKVKTFTAEPQKLGAYGPLHDKSGRPFTVKGLKPGKGDEAVVTFAEIGDRDAAEAAKGIELFVTRAALPETAEEEFYHADLLGLDVDDNQGRRIGKVLSIQNYGAGDLLVIAGDSGDEIWLAFTRENVPEIDIANRRIIVAVPEEVEARPAHDME
ncbi:16S rRNA processing protein RimM [Rhizomicrobium palustre]|uniref:Ribosome maturation factor RimM n=2 Tax=Rhizomicrobium palustre TaxID=189966 RepID=A0A846MZE3_9PROT|nr:16S rRNA processing protein RimM [Rhizomicrobium palustre]